MPPRKKDQPGESEQQQEFKQSAEIVPYEDPPIPSRLAQKIREYFRFLGVEVEFDNEARVCDITARFADQAEIKIRGGDHTPSIGFLFYSGIPKFASADEVLAAIRKKFYKIRMFCKFEYLDIRHGDEDRFGDRVSMAKEIDTTDEDLVMAELERVTKLIGHHKPRKGVKKTRRQGR